MTTATTIISISITIAGFIFGIIGSVFRLSVEYGRLKKTVEANENRDKEEREKTREKFSKLYATTNSHESTIAKLSNDISNTKQTLLRIESKLDRLIEKDSTKWTILN